MELRLAEDISTEISGNGAHDIFCFVFLPTEKEFGTPFYITYVSYDVAKYITVDSVKDCRAHKQSIFDGYMGSELCMSPFAYSRSWNRQLSYSCWKSEATTVLWDLLP